MSKTLSRHTLADLKCQLEKLQVDLDALKGNYEHYKISPMTKPSTTTGGVCRLYELKIIIKEAEVEMKINEIAEWKEIHKL